MTQEAPKYLSESQRRAFDKGFANGMAEGIAEGTAQGLRHSVLKILARRALPVSDEQRRRIAECTDLVTLDRWFDEAFLVTSVDVLLA